MALLAVRRHHVRPDPGRHHRGRARLRHLLRQPLKGRATIGVADHAGWAILITVGAGAAVLDRRRVELVDAALPSMPHHHPARGAPIDEAVAMVARVRAAAAVHAAAGLDALAAALPVDIAAIALRERPLLPATVAERITDYRAQCVADWVMYRDVLAEAAEARGWRVAWYDARTVEAEAARALGRDRIGDLLALPRAALGPPWQKDHKVAMAAAIACSSRARSLRIAAAAAE